MTEKMTVEIGRNLKYQKFELLELTASTLTMQDGSKQIQFIDVTLIKEVDIVGVKSNSGFCGSMEWGMSNPTFILPTNFFYNIINLFRRKNDIVHIRVDLKDGKQFIVLGSQSDYNQMKKIIK